MERLASWESRKKTTHAVSYWGTSYCYVRPVLPTAHTSFLTLVASGLFLFSWHTAHFPFPKSDSIKREISQVGWFEYVLI